MFPPQSLIHPKMDLCLSRSKIHRSFIFEHFFHNLERFSGTTMLLKGQRQRHKAARSYETELREIDIAAISQRLREGIDMLVKCYCSKPGQ